MWNKRAYPIMIVAFAAVLALGLGWEALAGKADSEAVGARAASQAEDELDEKVFPKDRVVDVKITIDEEDFQDMLDNASAEELKTASVEYNGIKLDNIGIRTKGNLSLRSVVSSDSDRYSFKLSFDEYLSTKTLLGIRKINLNNNYSDATYMREFLTYELAETMGLPTPKFSYVNVYINGKLWGFYLAIEQIGDAYLERNFDNSYGALYKAEFNIGGGGMGGGAGGGRGGFGGFGGMERPRQDGQAQNGATRGEQAQGEQAQNPFRGGRMQGGGFGGGLSGGGDLVWKDDKLSSYSALVQKSKSSNDDILIDMLDELNHGSDYESVLDVEGALKYIALNAVTVNMDSYLGSNQQNYYLYESKGIFSILPWDYNMAFGGMGNSNVLLDEPTQGAVADRPLVDKLLKVESYKEKYHEIVQTAIDGYLSEEAFAARVADIQALISPYVKADPRPFYTYEQFENAIPQLLSTNKTNVDNFAQQLDGTIPSSGDGSGSGGGMGMGMGGMGGGFGGFGGNNDIPAQNGQGQQPLDFQAGQMPDSQGQQPPDFQDGQQPDFQGGLPADGQFPAGGPGGGFPDFGGMPGGAGGMPDFGMNGASASADGGSLKEAYYTLGGLLLLAAAGLFITRFRRRA